MGRISRAKIEATRKWNEKNYYRIALTVPKAWEQRLKEHAKSKATSVNGLLNACIAGLLDSEKAEGPPIGGEQATEESEKKPKKKMPQPDEIKNFVRLRNGGKSYGEIAKISGYSKSTVQKHVERSRESHPEYGAGPVTE